MSLRRNRQQNSSGISKNQNGLHLRPTFLLLLSVCIIALALGQFKITHHTNETSTTGSFLNRVCCPPACSQTNIPLVLSLKTKLPQTWKWLKPLMLQLLNVLEAEPGGSRVNMHKTQSYGGWIPQLFWASLLVSTFSSFSTIEAWHLCKISVSRFFWAKWSNAFTTCIPIALHLIECWCFNLWSHWPGRVNKLEPEPIKISASISSSLFSVFCGMSWQGWAAPSWAFGVWISVCQFQELFSEGANVRVKLGQCL